MSLLLCPICGGSSGERAGSRGSSLLISELNADTSRTCLCGVSAEHLKSMMNYQEQKLDVLLRKHFPKAKSIEDVLRELGSVPTHDILRTVMVGRYSYLKRLRDRWDEAAAKEEARPQASVVPYSEEEEAKMAYSPPVPNREGGSLKDWFQDLRGDE